MLMLFVVQLSLQNCYLDVVSTLVSFEKVTVIAKMCRVIDNLSTISFGLIFLSLFCCSSSTTYGSAQYIVNRIDYDDSDTLLFDFESGTPYKNCGGNSAVKSVELTPCDEISEGHCVLRRGVNATCHLSFESEENSTTLTAKVYGIIGVIPIPFPCPQVNTT